MTVIRLIKYLSFFFLLFLLLFNYLFYLDISNRCFIRIKTSFEFSNSTIKKALKVLRYASPEDYQTVCQNVDTINTNVSCGGFGGGCFQHGEEKNIYVSTYRRSLDFTVGVIVHETYHVIQYKEGRPSSETECNIAMNKTLKKVVEF